VSFSGRPAAATDLLSGAAGGAFPRPSTAGSAAARLPPANVAAALAPARALPPRPVAGARVPTQEEWAEVEALERAQNDYLLQLLAQEQQHEADRERLHAAAPPGPAQQRLEAVFQVERARAAALLQSVQRQHEMMLAKKLEMLGVTP
jgi:hypothetical protein